MSSGNSDVLNETVSIASALSLTSSNRIALSFSAESIKMVRGDIIIHWIKGAVPHNRNLLFCQEFTVLIANESLI